MKKSKTTQRKQKQQTIKKALIIIGVVALLGQLVFNWLVYSSLQRTQADTQVADIIVRAIDDMLQPAAVDAASGKVYLSEQKLVLPVSEVGPILYHSGIGGDEVSLTSKPIMIDAKSRMYNKSQQYHSVFSSNLQKVFEEIFDQVPNLQACSRVVHIAVGEHEPTEDGYEVADTKRLTDGRTVTIYKETGCTSPDLDKFVKYVRELDSY